MVLCTQLLQVEQELCLPALSSAHLGLVLPPSLSGVSGREGGTAWAGCRLRLPVPHPEPRMAAALKLSQNLCLGARPGLTQAPAPSWHPFCAASSTEVTLIPQAKQTNPTGAGTTHSAAAAATGIGVFSSKSSCAATDSLHNQNLRKKTQNAPSPPIKKCFNCQRETKLVWSHWHVKWAR